MASLAKYNNETNYTMIEIIGRKTKKYKKIKTKRLSSMTDARTPSEKFSDTLNYLRAKT